MIHFRPPRLRINDRSRAENDSADDSGLRSMGSRLCALHTCHGRCVPPDMVNSSIQPSIAVSRQISAVHPEISPPVLCCTFNCARNHEPSSTNSGLVAARGILSAAASPVSLQSGPTFRLRLQSLFRCLPAHNLQLPNPPELVLTSGFSGTETLCVIKSHHILEPRSKEALLLLLQSCVNPLSYSYGNI